jgi:hypothetical protein
MPVEEEETREEQGLLVVEQEEPLGPFMPECEGLWEGADRIPQPHSASDAAPQPQVQAICTGPAIVCTTPTGPTRVRIERAM